MEDIKFFDITWKSQPQMIVFQTKMTIALANGPNQPIYSAKAEVTLASDYKSYSIKLPALGSTEACVIFIPSENDQKFINKAL